MNSRAADYKAKYAARNKEYGDFVKDFSPLQSILKSLVKAFAIGGAICCLGQLISDLTMLWWPKADVDLAGTVTGVVLIFLTCLLTGVGVFDKLGLIAGGGTFLPITGFANSISSAAMEYKAEGMIFGLAAKFFSIAGAVVVNGILASFAVGLVYWVLMLCGVNLL